MKHFAIALSFVISSISSAFAWGAEGHRIIAEIAEQYLEPAAVHQVRELLALENETTLADVSTWADEIRPPRRAAASWHYVDVPIHPPAGTPRGLRCATGLPDRRVRRG